MAGAHGLAVDVPGGLPDFYGDLIEEFGVDHEIAEFSCEDDRESFDGEKEICSGRTPGAIARMDGATTNDVVDVGMILQGSAPGMKHTEEAREIAADVFGVGGKFFQRI